MNTAPQPVVFEPIFKPKPWGGRRLAEVLGKRLPPGVPIGESWELADLPGAQTRVRAGPLAGRTLTDLLREWGDELMGGAALWAGHFPLLVKFLDAREDLSVQVHPIEAELGVPGGVKHEAWYVLHAAPNARLYAGIQPTATPDELARCAGRPQMVGLLRAWPVRVGEYFYLPAGTVHALGAGLLVAEIQTPSDATYRLYDWQRVGLDGRPRELAIETGLANIRYDLTDSEIRPTPRPAASPLDGLTATRIVDCAAFRIDLISAPSATVGSLPAGCLRVWVLCRGAGRLVAPPGTLAVRAGDVVLIPAGCAPTVGFGGGSTLLEARLPNGK